MSRGTRSSRVVVTGASGFVGANLVRHLAAKGFDTHALGGPRTSPWRLKGAACSIDQIDLTSRESVRSVVQRIRPSVVINCAAYGAYSSQTDVDRIYEVNVEGVRNLLDCVSELDGLEAFLQLGTSSEYGFRCTAPKEDSLTVPDSHYAVSKVSATAMVQYYARKSGLPAWCFRLYSVYGPYEDASRLIPRLLFEARQGRLPPLVNPSISRDFVYAGDVGKAVENLLRRARRLPKGEIFNIGTGKPTTLKGLVTLGRRIFNVEMRPDWGSMPDRHWDHPRWFANPAKAWKGLGWRATTSLEKGLEATMRWMDANPDTVASSLENTVLQESAR